MHPAVNANRLTEGTIFFFGNRLNILRGIAISPEFSPDRIVPRNLESLATLPTSYSHMRFQHKRISARSLSNFADGPLCRAGGPHLQRG